MSRLKWSDALSLDMPGMDDGHKTLVALLDLAHEAPDSSLLGHWRNLVTHTASVFEREDRWMNATRFSSTHIHTTQHKVVLQVMHEGQRAGESGDLAVIRKMAAELGLIPGALADAVRDAYREYRHLQHGLRLNGAQYARVPPDQAQAARATTLTLWTLLFGPR